MSSTPEEARGLDASLDAEAAVSPASPSLGDQVSTFARVLFTLVRREFWEHRVLWIAPLAVVALLVLSALLSGPGIVNFNVSVQTAGSPGFSGLMGGSRLPLALFGLEHWGITLPLYGVLVLVLTFYLSDCLYAERRDRSILFWKSLPVSDLTTVLAKALTGMVLVPCALYLVAVGTDLLLSGIWTARSHLGATSALLQPWNTGAWLKLQALLGLGVVLSILWFAPIGAYLMLVSAWARRNVFLWSAVPPLIAPLLERQVFGSTHLWDLLHERTFGLWNLPEAAAAWESAKVQLAPDLRVVSPVELYDALPVAHLFTNIPLWAGVVVAVILVALTARIRSHRDDA